MPGNVSHGVSNSRLKEHSDAIVGAEEVEFRGGLRMLSTVYDNLHPYQRTGVRWLWELHQQNAGGIVGDEMGTLQWRQRACIHRD